MHHSRVILVATFSIFVFTVYAQESINCELISSVTTEHWGTPIGLSLEGNLVYVLEDRCGVRVIDVSRPEAPAQIGLFNSDQSTWDLAVNDGIGYIAAGREGISVIDLSDPFQPVEICRVGDLGNARGLFIDADRLYVAAGENGLLILSIGNPARPQVMGACATSDFALSVVVNGEIAYVADRNGGLQIVDVADWRNPAIVSSLEGRGETRDVAFQNGFVYLAEVSAISQVDVSDPVNPTRVIECGTHTPAISITVQGRYAYSSQSALYVHDIEDELSEVGNLRCNPRELEIANNCFYLTVPGEGLRILNMGDPEAIVELGRCGTRLEFKSLALTEDLLILQTEPIGLVIYDRTDPANLIIVWQDSPVEYSIMGDEVMANDNFIYSFESINGAGRLSILNIEEPAEAHRIGIRNAPPRIANAALNGNLISYTYSNRQAVVVDVEDPVRVMDYLTLTLPAAYRIISLLVNDGYAYYVTDRDSLFILDIADRREIREVAAVRLESDARSMEIYGDHLYVCCATRFIVFDITRPFETSQIGSLGILGGAFDAAFSGDFAFLACESNGLQIVKINNPANMEVCGSYDPGWFVYRVAVSDSIAFVTKNGAGCDVVNCALAMGPNRPPVWIECPDSVYGMAGQEVRFQLRGYDINSNDLRMILLSGNLPPSAMVWGNPVGLGSFLWRTTPSDTGTFLAEIVLTDGMANDTARVFIEIFPPAGAQPELIHPPDSPLLISAFPNPFNSRATISYTLPTPGRYAIDVIDIQGRLVTRLSDQWREAGSYREVLNGGQLTSGEYFVKLNSNKEYFSTPITIIK